MSCHDNKIGLPWQKKSEERRAIEGEAFVVRIRVKWRWVIEGESSRLGLGEWCRAMATKFCMYDVRGLGVMALWFGCLDIEGNFKT